MNLPKITRVAGREFASTAMTKGFIIGALVVPAVLAMLMPIVIKLAMSVQPPADTGTIYVLDRSDDVSETLAQRLSPEEVKQRWEKEFVKKLLQFPDFRVITTAPDADIEELKAELKAQIVSGLHPAEEIETLLAIIEVDADATKKLNEDEGYGAYQIFFRQKLNQETVSEIKEGIRWSIR